MVLISLALIIGKYLKIIILISFIPVHDENNIATLRYTKSKEYCSKNTKEN